MLSELLFQGIDGEDVFMRSSVQHTVPNSEA